jgi:hypothetical protein
VNQTGGDNSSAIFAQSVGGGGGNGGASNSSTSGGTYTGALTLGGSGGTGANAGIVQVNAIGNLSATGDNSSAIFAQSVGGGGGNGADASSNSGLAGATGIVIVRYLGAQRGSGGTVTSAGGYTIHTFATAGTFTFTG